MSIKIYPLQFEPILKKESGEVKTKKQFIINQSHQNNRRKLELSTVEG
jgi:hypothetical protein